ncbi:hypothetical protein, partial [Veillonella sp.]|uniref:hypothetical protein n=1 Tax=Veillonella sp. TaxID=1926307 RepID=UPI0025E68BDB
VIVTLITLGIFLFESNYYRYVITSEDNSIYDKETQTYLINNGQSMTKDGNSYYAYKQGYYIVFDDETRKISIYRENQDQLSDFDIKIKDLQNKYDLRMIESVDNMDNITKDKYNYLRFRKGIFQSQGIY